MKNQNTFVVKLTLLVSNLSFNSKFNKIY